MQRFLLVAGLLLFPCLQAIAQDRPRAEVSFGYSYLRSSLVRGTPVNLNGWQGEVQGNLNEWFGVVGNFSGHYGTLSGASVNLHSFLFGPRLTYRKAERPTPFVHVLFGGARAASGSGASRATDTAFAWAFGGGLDVKVHERVALRVAQADYVQTRFGGKGQNNVRLSFGLVLRIGKQ